MRQGRWRWGQGGERERESAVEDGMENVCVCVCERVKPVVTNTHIQTQGERAQWQSREKERQAGDK